MILQSDNFYSSSWIEHTPLWQRGVRGDFINHKMIASVPKIPLHPLGCESYRPFPKGEFVPLFGNPKYLLHSYEACPRQQSGRRNLNWMPDLDASLGIESYRLRGESLRQVRHDNRNVKENFLCH